MTTRSIWIVSFFVRVTFTAPWLVEYRVLFMNGILLHTKFDALFSFRQRQRPGKTYRRDHILAWFTKEKVVVINV